MSTVDEFYFVVSDPKQPSKRERELQNSQARAHAAQVSHARRRVRSPLTLNPGKTPSIQAKRQQVRKKQSDDSAEDDASRSPRTAEAASIDHVHHLTVLRKGNSDPFNACAIPITAETSEALTFYNKNILPLFVDYMEAEGLVIASGRASWHDRFSNLSDPYSASGLLARTSALMSRSTGAGAGTRLAVQASTSKARLLQLLRAHLLQGGQSLRSPDAIQCMISLLITAVFEDALEDAVIHLTILKSLLYLQSAESPVDFGLLFTVAWYDFQQASKTLTRPILDFDGWVAEQFRPGWEQALRELPPLSGWAETDLNKSIKDQKLRDLFIKLRELREMSEMLSSGLVSTTSSTLISIAQWALACQGQLLNRYVDSISLMSQDSKHIDHASNPSEGKWACHTKAYLCLAALWWTRRLKKEENLPTRPTATVINAGGTILPALQLSLTQSELCSRGQDWLVNSGIRLWALHVGALAEQQGRHIMRSVSVADDGWFTHEFITQAKAMGLREWSEIRGVLQGIVYSDALGSDLSRLFVS